MKKLIILGLVVCFTVLGHVEFPDHAYGRRRGRMVQYLPGAINSSKDDNCVHCHSRLKGPLKRPVEQWKNSVHFKKDEQCNICHGGNPAVKNKRWAKLKKYSYIGRPGRYAIIASCGRAQCHNEIIASFKAGPHYESLSARGRPDCTECHGSHSIGKPDISIINEKRCYDCHEKESMQKIITRLRKVHDRFVSVENDIDYLRGKQAPLGSITDDYLKTKKMFLRLIHQSSKDDVKSYMSILEFGSRNLANESSLKVSLIKRLDLLYIIMVIFGLSIIAMFGFYSIFMYSKRKK